jgi:hypothetical protein
MAFSVQMFSNRRDREALALRRLSTKLSHAIEHGLLSGKMAVWFHTLNTLATSTLSLACGAKLQHDHVLLEFCDCTENLPNQAPRWIVTAGQIHSISSQNARADLRELTDDHLLHHQVARESIGAFDDDGTHSVRFEPVKQCGQSGAIR